ncbi:MAG: hypothetical protein ABIH37_03180 [archaeon]
MNKRERQKEIQELKEEYFRLIEKFTPNEIKNKPFFDLSEGNEIKLVLDKKLIEKYNVEDWLANYKKEAQVSTGGIRGPQNAKYYWDTRFPLNQLGVALATIGKALVLKDEIKNKEINKNVSGEVRYNTGEYIELISRIQAAMGIHTHMPINKRRVPVWMTSFLIFMNGYEGGEYVTSSHGVSSKIATKDINEEGSMFLPETSLKFVEKIEDIVKTAKKSSYTINLSSKKSKLISEDFDGIETYVNYLRKNVARESNLNLIKKAEEKGFKLMYDCVGGCMYETFSLILKELEILKTFEWRNIEKDSFFHGIGKVWKKNDKTGKKEFFDYSCDFVLKEVIESAGIEYDLKDKPVGYLVLITDPDGDRLVLGQIEPIDRLKEIEKLGAYYVKIDDEKIFVVYGPTYTFFLIMDYYMKLLKDEDIYENHPRFIITTTPSSKIWNRWAEANKVKVVETPVGIKEIATVIRKVEKQILKNPKKDVKIEDAFGREINLGKDSRMIFGGEESGGMIIGLEDFMKNKKGKKAMAVRDKSAGEASIIATGLGAYLFEKKKLISEQLDEVFKRDNIEEKQYVIENIIYYNESEPDPDKIMKEKKEGEIKRDKIDSFYTSISVALKNKKITLKQAKEILQEVIPKLDVEKIENIEFTGDATYFTFSNKTFIQIRKSGTDAKMKAYGGGINRSEIEDYIKKLLYYSGDRGKLFKKIIPLEYQKDIYSISRKIYLDYLYKGL